MRLIHLQSDLLPFTRTEYRKFNGIIMICSKCPFRWLTTAQAVTGLMECPACGQEAEHLRVSNP